MDQQKFCINDAKKPQRNLEQFTVAQFLLPLKTICCEIRNREVFFQKNILKNILKKLQKYFAMQGSLWFYCISPREKVFLHQGH